MYQKVWACFCCCFQVSSLSGIPPPPFLKQKWAFFVYFHLFAFFSVSIAVFPLLVRKAKNALCRIGLYADWETQLPTDRMGGCWDAEQTADFPNSSRVLLFGGLFKILIISIYLSVPCFHSAGVEGVICLFVLLVSRLSLFLQTNSRQRAYPHILSFACCPHYNHPMRWIRLRECDWPKSPSWFSPQKPEISFFLIYLFLGYMKQKYCISNICRNNYYKNICNIFCNNLDLYYAFY